MRRVRLAGGIALALAAGILTVGPASATSGPTWSTAQRLSSGKKQAETPAVAVDSKGNATAVWWQGPANDNTGVIMATHRPAGGTWSAPRSVSGPVSTSVIADTNPQIVVDSRGKVTAAWGMFDANTLSLYVASATMRPNGTWSSPVRISPKGTYAGGPQLAIDTAGDVFAAWGAFSNNTHNSIVQAADRPAGGSWSRVKTLSDATHNASAPYVAVDPAGDEAVVWGAVYSGYTAVDVARRTKGSAWGARTQISGASVDTNDAAVAAIGDNTFAVAYGASDGSNYVLQFTTQSTGAWSAPTALSSTGQDADVPRIAVDPSGDVTVVWAWGSSSSKNRQIQASTLPNGSSTWGSVATLSDTTNDAQTPAITTDSAGDMVAAWAQSDGTNYLAQAAVLPSGATTWGSATTLSAAGQDATLPYVAASASGNFAVLWSRSNGSYDRVQESQYDLAGPVSRVTEPRSKFLRSTKFTVGWVAKDWSAIASYDVRVDTAPLKGGFGGAASWLSGTTSTSSPYAVKQGTTHCFSVEASDTVGNAGSWSGRHCLIAPLDDRAATASAGWAQKRIRGFFRRTASVTSTRGSRLKFTGVTAKHIALLVEKLPSGGKIRVSFKGNLLGVCDTSSAKVHKKALCRLSTGLSADVTGPVILRYVSDSSKTVRIDGIYAIK